ncbi:MULTISPECIES: glycosyltransferase family 1 protein [unclassified Ruegeria]|uniref:glycosyltransferase family 4 protein n=1 Tax=unclassified Ruegeria TaxID=2625375 RepID=UPI001491DAB6|nr:MULTISPECIES: glycosyltransferase family 1 protein [unclassified Ruegeria]NOD78584.1 glycosyltransferase [Ruegeria sp. HKCCD4332]NOD90957.1 glycosyltransferase [Ruegeria sp. HKCCD4318]NOD95177.1 glycosyltransferase [Ruegeria sp. HKCCD4884]NOE16345.1 glycosyltransferase [Ruegeria sp. HKCCD4318-2]NOG11789.1 glycosyltransferase family 4 protein [Ruegeria sp. HKCCD4315]
MPHITIDATSWENERGFGRFTRNLIVALAARDSGFRYTLLFDQEPTRPVPDGVKTLVAGSDTSMSEASSGAKARGGADLMTMARAARRIECDVFFYPAVYSYFPLPARRPTVVCYHDTIPERFPDLIFPKRLNFRLWQIKCWLAKKQATRVMTISEASAKDLTRLLHIPRDRIDIITEGAESMFRPIGDQSVLIKARQTYGIPPEAPLLVYLGGFNRHKNVLRLIEAMPRILAHVPDVYLAIVGRTTGARFWDNIEDLKASAASDAARSEHILFTGEIDDTGLSALLNTADALVFPSLWEGFGLPALEAMSCGTPVLSSDRGSLPEVVGDGGLYYDPLSDQALADQAVRLLTEPDLRDDLSQKALARASEFSWDKGAELAEASFRRAMCSK